MIGRGESASGSKKDNGSAIGKVRVRLDIAKRLGPDARVLEGFAGEGEMWRSVWRQFGGACIEWDKGKAAAAAEDRQRWSVYAGDTERALLTGWMSHVPFDVVDLDAYGSPWKYARAWFVGRRLRARMTTIVLTDGYMARASLSAPCGTLFPGRGTTRMSISTEMYLGECGARLAEWAAASNTTIASFRTYKIHRGVGIQMRAHVIEVHSSGPPMDGIA